MLEITVQREIDGTWPVVAEHHRHGMLLPIRSEGRLDLTGEPTTEIPQLYGEQLGRALFQKNIRDAFVRARTDEPDGLRVLLSVEPDELKIWRWEWLCGPMDAACWNFLSLDQRIRFSQYLPSLTDRAFPPLAVKIFEHF